MTIPVLLMLFGGLVTLVVFLLWRWRFELEREFTTLVNEPAQNTATQQTKRMHSYFATLSRDISVFGQAQQAGTWLRFVIVASVMEVCIAVLLRTPLLLALIAFTFAIPQFYARTLRRSYDRALRAQTRFTKLFIAFLMRSGATLSDTLRIAAEKVESPMREKIREVNVKKRYTTLPGALQALGVSTGLQELRDFSVLVSESELGGTPVAEALMRSLRLDAKVRDANASKRYGDVQLELALYSTLFIAIPGFAFVMWAVVAYMLKLFGGFSIL